MKKTKAEKVEAEVKDDVKEAVQETRAAWRALLRPRVIITSLVFVLLLVLVVVAYKLYVTVTAPLTIQLLPNEAYLSLENDESASVAFALRANNYLSCSALCDARLYQDGVVAEQSGIVLRNNEHNLSFALSAPARGEGKEVYSLEVVCSHLDSLFCRRDDQPVYESALITMDYSLAGDAREVFDEDFSHFLQLLWDAETDLNEAIAYHSVLGGKSALGDHLALFDVLLARSRELRSAILDWRYPPVPLSEATILRENAASTLQDFKDAYAAEEDRLARIANLSIDARVGGVLRETTLAAEWDDFVLDYQNASGSDLPLRYAAFYDEARIRLPELLLSLNVTNMTWPKSFAEQWDAYCQYSCSPYPVPASSVRVPLLPPFAESTIQLSYAHASPACPDCVDAALPILFLHGHSMYDRNNPEWSLGTFTAIVRALADEGLVLDAGILTPYSATVPFPAGAWKGLPVAVRGTYYYDTYLSGGSYVLSWEQSESIDTYAIRVKELVDTLRIRTKSDKIVIVAHSMGGLVARRYAQLFGDEALARLILVGTPNNGISGSVAGLCPWLGADKECREISAGSAMLARINDPSRQPAVSITVIYGSGCEMKTADGLADGDGVVTVDSARLLGAENIEVPGSCSGTDLLHGLLVEPPLYAVLLEEIMKIYDS